VTPIHAQARESPEEMLAYEEAKAMVHYNKPHGIDAVFYADLSEKRHRLSEFSPANLQILNPGVIASGSSAGKRYLL
jgi:hypothetical protein